MDVELADSESACPIYYRWSIVNFSLISYRLGIIKCFIFKGEFCIVIRRFGGLCSPRPEICFGIKQTPKRHDLTPKQAFEKVGSKIINK